MNDFTFTGQGFSDYLYWQTQDRKTAKEDQYFIGGYTAKRSHAGDRKAGTVEVQARL